MVHLMRRNIEANTVVASGGDGVAGTLSACELVWGSVSKDEPALERDFDVILVSDCINPIYGRESWRLLADTICSLSTKDTVTLLGYEHREGDCLADFHAYSESFLRHECLVRKDKLRLYRITLRTS
eukprot:GFYU01051767.1.p1 GENE.GFYU01051767.1~~GFYU01051767.1.p1  ORF type:complete len:127 (-),score=13.51 GFYU01051767.1:135-515(-)